MFILRGLYYDFNHGPPHPLLYTLQFCLCCPKLNELYQARNWLVTIALQSYAHAREG